MAIIQYQAGIKTINAVLQIGMPAVTRICIAAAVELKFPAEDGEDIAQEVATCFETEIAKVYDGSRPIYPLLRAYARNKVLALTRKRREVHLTKIANQDALSYDNGTPEDAATDRLFAEHGLAAGLNGAATEFGSSPFDDALDKAAALRKIGETLDCAGTRPTAPPEAEMIATTPSVTSIRRLPPVGVLVDQEQLERIVAREEATTVIQRVPRAGRMDPQGGQRLRQIKKQLKMTADEMAAALAIKPATLIAYLHGKTKGAPKTVVSLAEAMLTNDNLSRRADREFTNVPMETIVQNWIKEYVPKKIAGAKVKDVEWQKIGILASMLGVADTTVMRWMKGTSGLRPRKIAAFDEKLRHTKPPTRWPPPPNERYATTTRKRAPSRPVK